MYYIKYIIHLMSEEKKEKTSNETSKKKIDCEVCCSTRSRFVRCIYCSKESCLDCCEKFILDHINPRCMFCNKVWNYEFLEKNMKKVFMKGAYKVHREKIIFEREKALFPDTQKEIEYIIHNEEINESVKEKRSQIVKLKKEIRELLQKHINYNSKVKLQKVTISYPCPKSTCRGFLKEDFTCGLCKLKLCKDCREEIKQDTDEQKHPEHVCDPSIVESIKAIQKESKPCPKCGTSISKIHGCDQMWCTICQTAFSWRTGEIDSGNVHNPHYWEYLQKKNKDVDEINRIIDGRDRRCIDLNNLSRSMAIVNNIFLRNIIRLLIHFQRIDIICYTNQNMVERNKDLRVEYLRNNIEENKMKSLLRSRDKKFTFNEEMTQILNTYYEVVKDSIISFYIILIENNMTNSNINNLPIFRENILNVINDTIQVSEYSRTAVQNLVKRYEYKSFIRSLNTIKEIEKICKSQLADILK